MTEFHSVWQSRRRQVRCCGIILLFLTLIPASLALAAEEQKEENLPPRLRQLELEQLLDIKVSTVSRTQSTVGASAAAIFVITQEDIRRSGATTIAELFRRVPGMNVARIDNSKWAIGARGFNDRYADMLLVQVDGRTVYNPLFAGVYWDAVVYPLDDIERIEVIRGPGTSMWGANAVNGVINIITKSARDTKGGVLTAGAGNMERGFGSLRYGGKIGDKAWYRLYGEGFDRLKEEFSTGAINDKWYVADIGSRLDWEPSPKNALFFDGQFTHARTGNSDLYPQLTPPFLFRNLEHEDINNGHLLGRLTHTVDQDSNVTLQLYWDSYGRRSENLRYLLRWDTYDLDFQHTLPLGERQKITYGFGYRLVDSSLPSSGVDNGFIFTWVPRHRDDSLFSAFVQDQVVLIQDRLSLLLGTKLEHNDFTGFEVQPTGRLLWTPTDRQSAWMAVSRGVRTPSILEDSVLLTLTPVATAPAVVYPRLTFNKGFKSEEVVAYEIGYRTQPAVQFSIDTAAFYNDYRNLRIGTFNAPTPGPDGTLIVPLVFENRLKGETYGVELAADWRPTDWWRLYGTYTFLEMKLHADRSLQPEVITAAESNQGHSPQHQVYLQSSWNVGRSVEFDLMARYVSRLTGFNPGNLPGFPDEIKAYASMDARLAWQLLRNLEISLVGQNLLDNHHAEFSSSPQGQILKNPLAEIRRSVYGRVKWDF
jgi:iron complex outermembrane recepter protein